MFGLQGRGVGRCEYETLLPKPGPLPQTSQTEATGSLHWVLVRWVVVPDAAGTVIEGYPTDAGSRDLGVRAASGQAGQARIAGCPPLPGQGPFVGSSRPWRRGAGTPS